MKSHAEIMQDLQDNRGETMEELRARRRKLTWRARWTTAGKGNMAGKREGFIACDWHEDDRWRVLPHITDQARDADPDGPAISHWELSFWCDSTSHIQFGGWQLVRAEFDTAEEAMAATLTMDPATGKERKATA